MKMILMRLTHERIVERLLEYRRYKEVSSILGEMADEAGKRFFREASNLPTKHLPPKGLDVKLFVASISKCARKPNLKMNLL